MQKFKTFDQLFEALYQDNITWTLSWDHNDSATADIDPDVVDGDLDPDPETDPAMHVLPTVERVSIVQYITHPFMNKLKGYVSSKRLLGLFVQVHNVANPGRVKYSLYTLKEAIQARVPTMAVPCVC